MNLVKAAKLGLESGNFANTTILGLQRITHVGMKLLQPQRLL